MSCPKCGCKEVRRSRRHKWVDTFHAVRQRKAYRCQECRARFYAKESGHASETRASIQKKHQTHTHRPSQLGGKRLRRRLAELVIFGVMLVLFLLFLRYLTRETMPGSESGRLPFAGQAQLNV